MNFIVFNIKKISFYLCLQLAFLSLGHATLDETEISELYQVFKQEYRHLSPINGLLVVKSGTLSNVRFYGNYGLRNDKFLAHRQISNPGRNLPVNENDFPNDYTTMLVQHMFPSPAHGVLNPPNCKSDIFKHLSVQNIAELLLILEKHPDDVKNKINILLNRKDIFSQQNKRDIGTSWKAVLSWGSNLKKYEYLAERLAEAFAESQREVTHYPPHFVQSALLALVVKKVRSAQDLKPFMEVLKEFVRPGVDWSNMNPAPFTKESYLKFKDDLKQNSNHIKTLLSSIKFHHGFPEDFNFFVLAYEKYEKAYNPIGQGEAIFAGEIFPDCTESVVRNLFNFFLGSAESRTFYVDNLTEAFPNASKKLISFYQKQKSFDDVMDDTLRNDWAEVVSAQNKENDPDKIIYRKKNQSNIVARLDNFLLLIEKLLMDEKIGEIRKENTHNNIASKKALLNYIFNKFSNDENEFSWEVQDDDLDDSYNIIYLLVDGKRVFTMEFMEGHAEFSADNDIHDFDEEADWRKSKGLLQQITIRRDNANLLPFFLDNSKQTRDFLKVRKDFLTRRPLLTKSYPALFLLYSFPLNGSRNKFETIETLSMHTINNVPLVLKWLESIPDDMAMISKVVSSLDLLLSNKHLTIDELEKNSPILYKLYHTDKILQKIFRDATDKKIDEKIILDDLINVFNELRESQIKRKDSSYGKTILHFMAYEDRPKIVEFLLEKVPDLAKDELLLKDNVRNISFHEIGQATPLHLAVEQGNIEVVKVFLEKAPYLFSDTNLAKNQKGYTALHSAVFWAKHEIVKLLLEKAPCLVRENKLLKDKGGRTPLHLLAMMMPMQTDGMLAASNIIEAFDQNSPSLFTNEDLFIDKQGRTLLHLLFWKKKYRLIDYLARRCPLFVEKMENMRDHKGISPQDFNIARQAYKGSGDEHELNWIYLDSGSTHEEESNEYF